MLAKAFGEVSVAAAAAAAERSWTYVLESSIQRLKLLPGELGLSLQLVQPLRLVAHGRQLQIAVAAVCGRKRECEKGMERQTGGEGKERGKEVVQREREREEREVGADIE